MLRMRCWIARKISGFRKDEGGAVMLLSLFLFVLMLVFGGIAVDVAHYERNRAFAQQQLDSAVLSAASLTQDIPAREVVDGYLASVGLERLEVQVNSQEDAVGGIVVGRTVSASAEAEVATTLMRLLGVSTLSMPLFSEASERVDNIEISIVLDVSGSMGLDERWRPDDRKIRALRQAAKDFVSEVLSSAEEGQVSISLIPYSTNVNAGADLLSHFETTLEHSYSNCIDFEGDAFEDSTLRTDRELQRSGHFQFQAFSYSDAGAGQWACRIDPGFHITPFSSSVSDLNEAIDALTPEGSTSIDIGTKWGLALLDPSTRPAIEALASEGNIDGNFSVRPFDYDADDAMKVLVIMTDGENDTEYRLRDEYRDGDSGVLRMQGSNGARYYSVDLPEQYYAKDGDGDENEQFFWAHHPFGSQRIWSNETIFNHDWMEPYRGSFSEERLDWPEVFAEMSPMWFGYNVRGRRLNYANWWASAAAQAWDDIHYEIGRSVKDERLRDICRVAGERGVVVFTIGFEVPSAESLDLLKDCASSEAHYFDVDGLEITSAFDVIASSINMLKLTK